VAQWNNMSEWLRTLGASHIFNADKTFREYWHELNIPNTASTSTSLAVKRCALLSSQYPPGWSFHRLSTVMTVSSDVTNRCRGN
jgi:hypothetical protein